VDGELVVLQRAVILGFPISIGSCVDTFLKAKTYCESENRFGHGRTRQIGCTGLVFVRLHTKHFSREVGLLLFEKDYTVHFVYFTVGR